MGILCCAHQKGERTAGGKRAPELPLHETDGHIPPACHFHRGLQLEGLASLLTQLGHSKEVAEELGREQKVNVQTSHPQGSLQGCCTNSWA